jgi:UDP-galactopyranose mutase
VEVPVAVAGFSGATAARILAEAGRRAHVIDARQHVGGDTWNTRNGLGVRVRP